MHLHMLPKQRTTHMLTVSFLAPHEPLAPLWVAQLAEPSTVTVTVYDAYMLCSGATHCRQVANHCIRLSACRLMRPILYIKSVKSFCCCWHKPFLTSTRHTLGVLFTQWVGCQSSGQP